MQPNVFPNVLTLATKWRAASIFAPAALVTSLLLTPIQNAVADPMVIAHRGGTGDTPENTVQAFHNALSNGADALWMTVQISQDGVPVMYRPADLSALTDGHGTVNSLPVADIQKLNAGYQFKHVDAKQQVSYPYRNHPLPIPTLRQAIESIPNNVPIMLDMKQVPVAPLVKAVAQVLDELHAWSRVRLYSTDPDALKLMSAYPNAHVFETRDATRERLVQVALAGVCENPPAPGSWIGIELDRKVEVIEHFTLGEGISKVNAHWWTPAAVSCFETQGNVHIVAFGVDSASDYQRAAALGIEAVMTDSPKLMRVEKLQK